MGRAQNKINQTATVSRRGQAADAFADIVGEKRGSGREDNNSGPVKKLVIEDRLDLLVSWCQNITEESIPDKYKNREQVTYPSLGTLSYAEERCSVRNKKALHTRIKNNISRINFVKGTDLDDLDTNDRIRIVLMAAVAGLIAVEYLTENEFEELVASARELVGDTILNRDLVLNQLSSF